MDTKEKLDTITNSNYEIAFDGCHKIYFCEDPAQSQDAKEAGYEIFQASQLPDIVKGSCSLRFVHPWSLADHPLDIDQGELGDDLDG